MSGLNFKPAERRKLRARVAVTGPTGSGKTWTGLQWATALGERVAFIDTENESALYYADQYQFMHAPWAPPYNPQALADAIEQAGASGDFDVLVIDSFSHFWEGEGGTLDVVDQSAMRGNSFTGWKVGTPMLRHLVDVIRMSPMHVIVCMRSKMEYVLEKNERGKQEPKRVGLAPVMRAGIEYEFTVIADMDLEHRLVISKSRCKPLADRVFPAGRSGEAVEVFRQWLDAGVSMATAEQQAAITAHFDGIEGDDERRALKGLFVARFGKPADLTGPEADAALEWLAQGGDPS